jgi:hypothetical protein
MPFLCILHGFATFRRFCHKSDIYTHFWTFLGDFALKCCVEERPLDSIFQQVLKFPKSDKNWQSYIVTVCRFTGW